MIIRCVAMPFHYSRVSPCIDCSYRKSWTRKACFDRYCNTAAEIFLRVYHILQLYLLMAQSTNFLYCEKDYP